MRNLRGGDVADETRTLLIDGMLSSHSLRLLSGFSGAIYFGTWRRVPGREDVADIHRVHGLAAHDLPTPIPFHKRSMKRWTWRSPVAVADDSSQTRKVNAQLCSAPSIVAARVLTSHFAKRLWP